MPDLLMTALVTALVLLSSLALFFFTATRGALLVRSVLGHPQRPAAHVYPIYSNLRLMRMVDFQPVIAAILLFQYDRLVTLIAARLAASGLHDKDVLITSCAFGNMIPRIVETSIAGGARKVLIVDLIRNELDHARRKLPELPGMLEFMEVDAVATGLPDASVAANVVFFLLHELPHAMKTKVLQEAVRVLAPGGQLYVAEFHRPAPLALRALSWTYFKVFEPWGLALWKRLDPLRQLEAIDGMQCERKTFFFGNFQVIVATKR